ncbi:MAG: hypothetical protein HRT47_09365 [Candidatus Caenarcaniphilales bacterium]|nr:hypothetical protein [Candidatus Caenarcaniphilales bacterium]
MDTPIFQINTLGLSLTILILFVGFIVIQFSKNYLSGDTLYKAYFIRLFALIISACLLVNTDNLIAFCLFFALTNALLTLLMVHKSQWKAALESGIVAARNFGVGIVCLLGFSIIVYSFTGELSISKLNQVFSSVPGIYQIVALSLICIAALTQSALFPFHGWLISSMNSPTPVSALMHAGIVNGGGFLLVKLSPMLLENPVFLPILSFIGALSAFLAMLWAFTKNTVKATLVCSTVSQMSFMVLQIGLGLFPAAISHLIMHGLFKAFHFLAAGSGIQIKRPAKLNLNFQEKTIYLLVAMAFSYVSINLFSIAAHIPINFYDSSIILFAFIFMALTQLSISILTSSKNFLVPFFAFFVSISAAVLYGAFIHFFELILASSVHMHTYAVHLPQWLLLSPFAVLWLAMNYKEDILYLLPEEIHLRIYAFLKNTSMSKEVTNTSVRGEYAN